MTTGQEFHWPVRVYYEDTDAGGVVYHASYLRFFERARTEWLRARGFTQSALASSPGIVLVVRSMTLDFHRPARLDDALVVGVSVKRVGRASLMLDQSIRRDGDGECLCEARGVKIACLSGVDFRPCALPQSIRTEIVNER